MSDGITSRTHSTAVSAISAGKAVRIGALSLAVHFVVALMVWSFLIRIVPVYLRFFVEQDVPLPAMTQQLLSMSDLTVRYWYLLPLAFFAFNGPLALGLQFLPQRLRWIKVCWFDGFLLAAIVFLTYANMALAIPFVAMSQSQWSLSP
jgi:type II secretory pathway component PulF